MKEIHSLLCSKTIPIIIIMISEVISPCSILKHPTIEENILMLSFVWFIKLFFSVNYLACHDILFTPKLANLSYYHLHPTHQRSLGNQITLSIYQLGFNDSCAGHEFPDRPLVIRMSRPDRSIPLKPYRDSCLVFFFIFYTFIYTSYSILRFLFMWTET